MSSSPAAIPFFKPSFGPEALESISEILKTGWLTTGPYTKKFEGAFAQYVGAKYAVMVNSGTAALHLSLLSLGVGPGDEVITTPYTFAATVEAIEYCGATPKFVDVRREDLNMDENLLPNKLSGKTKALIPVHFAGNPCNMKAILDFAEGHGLSVIEDAAHCTPAYFRGKSIGSLSPATCFSFYANKCITTGEGGMVTTNDKNVYEKVLRLRLHGMSKDAVNRYAPGAHPQYDIVELGFKYNPTDISAALGLEQLNKADVLWEKRKNTAKVYMERLGGNSKISFVKVHFENDSSWHLFPIRLEGKLSTKRDQVMSELADQGISTSIHFRPIHLMTHFQQAYALHPNAFPVANEEYKKEISLPLYPDLQQTQVHYICDTLLKILNKF